MEEKHQNEEEAEKVMEEKHQNEEEEEKDMEEKHQNEEEEKKDMEEKHQNEEEEEKDMEETHQNEEEEEKDMEETHQNEEEEEKDMEAKHQNEEEEEKDMEEKHQNEEEEKKDMEETHQNEEEEKDYSKMKKEVKMTKEVKKKKRGKVWSEEDEISLLNGYYEYQIRKKGKSEEVTKEGDAHFYDFIKSRLNGSLKQSQVSHQIHRLKKYFVNQNNDSKDNGADDPHQQKLFQISSKIWNSVDENVLCPMMSTVGIKFDLSNDFLSKEFDEFVYSEGVVVSLMDDGRVRDLKRKFGEVEVCRSKYEFKQAKLSFKFENLKFDHFETALKKFC